MPIKEKIKRTKEKIISKAKEAYRETEKQAKTIGVGMATAFTIAGTMAPTEANAQGFHTEPAMSPTTQQSSQRQYDPEVKYVYKDGKFIPVQNSASQNQGRTAPDGTFQQAQRQQTVRRQQAQPVATGPVVDGVQLQYSPAYSYGLQREFVGAYENPYHAPKEDFIYFYKRGLDGRPNLDCVLLRSEVDAGLGPYALSIEARRARLGGAYGWGVPMPGGPAVQGAHEVLDVIGHAAEVADRVIHIGRHRHR